MSITLGDSQNVDLKVTGKDEAGNPATFTGTPSFALDNTDLASLTDNGDGTANVRATGGLGTVTVTVTDAETDGEEFQGSAAIDIVAEGVKTIDVEAGTPVENDAS